LLFTNRSIAFTVLFKFHKHILYKLFKLNSFHYDYDLISYKKKLLYYVDPNKIKFIAKQRRIGYLDYGDWDLELPLWSLHPCIKELFVDNIPYIDSTQFSYMNENLKKKGYSYWCKSVEDIHKYFKLLISTSQEILSGVYKAQHELPLEMQLSGSINEILVSVNRSGDLCLENGGGHRLSLSRLASLKRIPVVIVRWHPNFLFNGDTTDLHNHFKRLHPNILK
jgi:hypothetical protein